MITHFPILNGSKNQEKKFGAQKIRAQKGHLGISAILGRIWLQITHMVYKIPHKLYISGSYSLSPSKSNNFEKMTYNEKFRFSNWFGGVKNNFWGTKFFFLIFWTIKYGKMCGHLNISK